MTRTLTAAALSTTLFLGSAALSQDRDEPAGRQQTGQAGQQQTGQAGQQTGQAGQQTGQAGQESGQAGQQQSGQLDRPGQAGQAGQQQQTVTGRITAFEPQTNRAGQQSQADRPAGGAAAGGANAGGMILTVESRDMMGSPNARPGEAGGLRDSQPGQAGQDQNQSGQAGQGQDRAASGAQGGLGQSGLGQGGAQGGLGQGGAQGGLGQAGAGGMHSYRFIVNEETLIQANADGGAHSGQAGQAGAAGGANNAQQSNRNAQGGQGDAQSQAGQQGQAGGMQEYRGLRVGQYVEVSFRPGGRGMQSGAAAGAGAGANSGQASDQPGQAEANRDNQAAQDRPSSGGEQEGQAGQGGQGRRIRGVATSIRVIPDPGIGSGLGSGSGAGTATGSGSGTGTGTGTSLGQDRPTGGQDRPAPVDPGQEAGADRPERNP